MTQKSIYIFRYQEHSNIIFISLSLSLFHCLCNFIVFSLLISNGNRRNSNDFFLFCVKLLPITLSLFLSLSSPRLGREGGGKSAKHILKNHRKENRNKTQIICINFWWCFSGRRRLVLRRKEMCLCCSFHPPKRSSGTFRFKQTFFLSFPHFIFYFWNFFLSHLLSIKSILSILWSL